MTEEELKLSFRWFNARFFSGVLPEMPIVYRESMYGEGAFECVLKETKMPYSVSMVEGTGAIEINPKAEDIQGVLMHEMVHAYFAAVGLGHELYGDRRHGDRFQRKCQRIEQAWGRSIPRQKA